MKRKWQEKKLKGTNFVIRYDIEPGYFVSEVFGIEFRVKTFAELEEFFRRYYESIHYYNDQKIPTSELIDCE